MKNQIGYLVFFTSVVVACWAMRNHLEEEAFAFPAESAVTSVDDLAEPLVKSGNAIGLSIGIVSIDGAGRVQTETRHYGKAADNDLPEGVGLPTDDTIYEIGGLANVFTGTLLASAVTRGEVTLKTPAQDLMPADVKMPSLGGRSITLFDLVTHRSGLPRLADNMPKSNRADPYQDYTSDLANEFLSSHKLSSEPGSRQEYSNFAVSYLGHLLTRTSRAEVESYDSVLLERIAGPLGMDSTKVHVHSEHPNIAVGHTSRGRVAAPWHTADMPGAGGIHSTIADMNRFMAAQLRPPENEIGKAIDLAFEQHLDLVAGGYAMGLGWLVHGDGMTRWHNGKTGGFASAMFVNRKSNMGVCVLCNSASDNITDLTTRVLQFELGIGQRDGAGYARVSPFSAVRWRDQIPEVLVNETWYELVSLNDHATDKIVAFSRRRYKEQWKQRFEEDLVELLSKMGHPPQDQVNLVVKSLGSEETQTLTQVRMTEENRRVIRNAAKSEK